MAKEIQLKDTTGAVAYEPWMKAPNPEEKSAKNGDNYEKEKLLF